MLNQAIYFHQNGHLDEAKNIYSEVIAKEPSNFDAHFLFGILFAQTGNPHEAIKLFQRATEINPQSEIALSNLGTAYSQIGNLLQALNAFNQAIDINQHYFEALVNKVTILNKLDRISDANNCYNDLIKLQNNNPILFNDRGLSFRKLFKYDESLKDFSKAITLNPNYAEAYSNRGNTYAKLNQSDLALADYSKAIALNPNYAEAYSNCANTLRTLRQYDQALVHYQRALTLDPHAKFLRGMALHLKMMMCDWSNYDDDIALLAQAIECGQVASEPFPILSIYNSLQYQLDLSSAYQADKFKGLQPIPWAAKYPKKERIRIAYYSTDFREHPVSLLLAELFEKHNRSQFEVFAFSLGENTNDPMRQRLKKAFDHFIDVQDLSDTGIVALSRKHEIDIAIDLGGYTAGSRSEIFQLRVAPIQISYIGYLGTMGTPCIDYLIADKVLIPAQLSPFYTENIAYLPSYQANVSTREIASRSFIRSEYGIPENHFVFCCFNNNYKITPPVFKSWMHILKEVQNSVLFLYAENQWVQSNLEKSALGHGVAKERLIFGQRLSTPEYLARYRIADLFLDTFPYNAGTTASDALWMGVPVLTLAGETFSSRMAASLLTAIDMPELITNTPAQFENRAIEIAKNRGLLSGLKSKLEDNKENTRLFDTPKFIQSLESCYLAMYERGLNDLDPTDLG